MENNMKLSVENAGFNGKNSLIIVDIKNNKPQKCGLFLILSVFISAVVHGNYVFDRSIIPYLMRRREMITSCRFHNFQRMARFFFCSQHRAPLKVERANNSFLCI